MVVKLIVNNLTVDLTQCAPEEVTEIVKAACDLNTKLEAAKEKRKAARKSGSEKDEDEWPEDDEA
jgi:hypothetical protein